LPAAPSRMDLSGFQFPYRCTGITLGEDAAASGAGAEWWVYHNADWAAQRGWARTNANAAIPIVSIGCA